MFVNWQLINNVPRYILLSLGIVSVAYFSTVIGLYDAQSFAYIGPEGLSDWDDGLALASVCFPLVLPLLLRSH